MTSVPHIAVIGAGLAGSMCARTLRAAGLEVTIVDKARGPGGRCSTRRASTEAGTISFDHGAQYFTLRDRSHADLLDQWIRAGVVAPWEAFIGTLERGRLGPEGRARDGSAASMTRDTPPVRYVGTPGMNAIVKALQSNLEVAFGCRVGRVVPEGNRWSLRPVAAQVSEAANTTDVHERPTPFEQTFDAVIVTAPPVQAVELLERVDSELATEVEAARLDPCWALMVQFDSAVRFAGPHQLGDTSPDEIGGLFVRDSPLSWAANQGTKPGRTGGRPADGELSPNREHWVLHASPEWSEAHLEDDATEVARLLLAAFADAAGHELPTVLHQAAHRWRYASVAAAGEQPYLWSDRGLGVCGDWCVGGRVEGALHSGRSLAEHIVSKIR